MRNSLHVNPQVLSIADWIVGGEGRRRNRKPYNRHGSGYGHGEQHDPKRDVNRAAWLNRRMVSVFHGGKECITWLAA